jgi:hypothetical protein
VTVKSGLSINLRLYGGLDWPSLAHAAPKGLLSTHARAHTHTHTHALDLTSLASLAETIVERQVESFFEVRLTGLKLRFDEFLRQPLFPVRYRQPRMHTQSRKLLTAISISQRRLALAVHDVTVVDNVGPAPVPRSLPALL